MRAPVVLRLFEIVQEWPVSIALRESLWVYPVIETAHVLGICVFLGLVAMMDLRLAGLAMRTVPLSEVQQRLFPWQMAGLSVMVPSGLLLVLSEPLRFYGNPFFRAKLVLLVVAIVNAQVFHVTVYRRVAEWDADPVPPMSARLAGVLSLVVWTGVVTCGRLIAYNWFK
jgi:hypothetical protein